MVVIGFIFVDIKGYPSSTYIPGGRNAGKVKYVHGGVSRNIAEDLGNLGLNPVFLSLTDGTGTGEDVLRRLEDHGVDTRLIRKVPGGMGSWLAVFDNCNDVCASISDRPKMGPLLELLQENGNECFRDADSIVVEIDMEKEIIKKVLSFAEKYRKKVFAVVANMSIASLRRDFLQSIDCFVCNLQEAGILFAADFEELEPEELGQELVERIQSAKIPSMVVTLGSRGAVYANADGSYGHCPPNSVRVRDTTGAGDAFCAGVAIGLTYGKSMSEAYEIGSRLASSVITISENTCPRFLPQELGLDVDVE